MFKRFTRAVFRDLGMKAVALVIAVLLWHYANTKVRDEVYIDVPLDVRVPNEYIKLRQNPKTILLLVRGPQELITSLRTRPARMGLRLEHAIASADLDERGHVALPVDPRRWNWQNLHDRDLAQLSFESMHPDEVVVYASPRITKELTVKVEAREARPPGYDIMAMPSTVLVSGPALLLNRPDMTEISTAPVFLSAVSYGHSVQLDPNVAFSLEEGLEVDVLLKLDPQWVTLRIVPVDEPDAGPGGPTE